VASGTIFLSEGNMRAKIEQIRMNMVFGNTPNHTECTLMMQYISKLEEFALMATTDQLFNRTAVEVDKIFRDLAGVLK
jgi:AAA+ superfamily predicted ATPase